MYSDDLSRAYPCSDQTLGGYSVDSRPLSVLLCTKQALVCALSKPGSHCQGLRPPSRTAPSVWDKGPCEAVAAISNSARGVSSPYTKSQKGHILAWPTQQSKSMGTAGFMEQSERYAFLPKVLSARKFLPALRSRKVYNRHGLL